MVYNEDVKHGKKKLFRFLAEPDLLEWLAREAAYRRSSTSQVLRELVVKAMEAQGERSENLKSPR